MSKHDHCHEDDQTCSCHSHGHHDHDNACGSGCRDDHKESCCCGCDHGEEKRGISAWLPFVLGGIPTILGFVSQLPLPVRVIASCLSYGYFGFGVFRSMLSGFRRRRIFTEFTLMCVATLGAFALGEFADAAAVMYLYSLGESLSSRTYARSRRNLSELIAITPQYATVVRQGVLSRVEPKDVLVGERIRVTAGERIPLDGQVALGSGEADTSSVTGEAKPRDLYEGVCCPSGALLLNGSVELTVTHPYEDSVASRLAQAVNEAAGRKSAAEKKISRFARVFTPLAFSLALLVALIGSLLSGNLGRWFHMGLLILVVSCPCSLVLSVPLTYYAGMGRGAARGIVFRGGEVIDAFCRIHAIGLDKTGTVTEAALRFDGAFPQEGVEREELLSLSYQILSHSPHAAAVSFCAAYCPPEELNGEITQVEVLSGRGVRCLIDGSAVFFGNAAFLREQGVFVKDTEDTVILGARDGVFLGELRFSAPPKEEAKTAVEELRRVGVERIAVLSGDSEGSVRQVCERVGIHEFYAALTPTDKVEVLHRMEQEERTRGKNRVVAFCGDGLNDSPVVAGAQIGIAMGSAGSALTVSSADAVMMDDDLTKLSEAIRIARKTSRLASQNITISLGIKLTVLLFGAGLLIVTGQRMSMELAIVADVGATILTVLNALRASR